VHKSTRHKKELVRLIIGYLYYKPSTSCSLCLILESAGYNYRRNKVLRSFLKFEFSSFEFVSDFGFSASDLVAAERSEAAPSQPVP